MVSVLQLRIHILSILISFLLGQAGHWKQPKQT